MWWAMQYPPDPLHATSSTRIFEPSCAELSGMVRSDDPCNIYQAHRRHVIGVHLESSFVELNVIL
jgi:hypothetical protein